MYLILNNDKCEIVETKREVLTKALIATVEWCHSPIYTGKNDFQAEYNECLESQDFGDIIKVFEITSINIPSFLSLENGNVGDTFQLKRVL